VPRQGAAHQRVGVEGGDELDLRRAGGRRRAAHPHGQAVVVRRAQDGLAWHAEQAASLAGGKTAGDIELEDRFCRRSQPVFPRHPPARARRHAPAVQPAADGAGRYAGQRGDLARAEPAADVEILDQLLPRVGLTPTARSTRFHHDPGPAQDPADALAVNPQDLRDPVGRQLLALVQMADALSQTRAHRVASC
jgi:hypothetical protein